MGLTRPSRGPGRSMSSSLRSLASPMPLLALVAVLLSMAAYPAQAQTAQECDANAAFDRLMSVKSTSALGELVTFLQVQNFDDELKRLAAGKAILAPHNSYMANKIYTSELKLANEKKGFSHAKWKLTDTQRGKVNNWLKKLVVDATEFRTAVKPNHPCDLVGVTKDLNKGVKGVMKNVVSVEELYATKEVNTNPCADIHRPGKGLGRKPGKMPNGKPFKNDLCVTKAFGKNGIRGLLQAQCVTPPTAQGYIPVGAGYDSTAGNPGTSLYAGTDPGLHNQAIFDFSGLTPADGVYCYTDSSQCTNFDTVDGSTAAKQTQSSMALGLGVSGSYKEYSFEANAEFDSSVSSSDAKKSFTAIAGRSYQRGTFTLNANAAKAKLNSAFLSVMDNIGKYLAAGDTNNLNAQLTNLYNTYGTHYVDKNTIGGEAQMTFQMSAQSSDSLKQQSISVSASAEASFGLATAKVSASAAGSNAVAVQTACAGGSFNSAQAPAGVSINFIAGGGSTPARIDCSSWANSIDAAGLYAYTGFTVKTFSYLINTFPQLFSSLGWSSSFAGQVATAIDNYMSSCPSGGCSSIPSTCAYGYYGSSPATGCTICSAADTTNSGLGSCATSPVLVPCAPSGQCYQQGLFGMYFNNFFGHAGSGNSADCKGSGNVFQYPDSNGSVIFGVMPSQSGSTTTYGYNGVYYAVTDAQLNSWNNGMGQQNGGTWQLTGYFIPNKSGNYKFEILGDQCAWMWLDGPGLSYTYTGGAKYSIPTASRAYIQSCVYGNWCPGSDVALTANVPYAIRIQLGNYSNGKSQLGISLKYIYNDAGSWALVGNGSGGYLYHNPDSVICGSDGKLYPQGSPDLLAANSGDTKDCINKCPQSCAYVGY